METHRSVLVVAYYFPPLGLSGVQRTLKFVKYLPQFGWQPTVLTITPTGYYAQDQSLLEEIQPYQIDVQRVGSLDPNRFFRKKGTVKIPPERTRRVFSFLSDLLFVPDNKIGWKKPAVNAGEELFKKTNFDVIFATAPPFTDFLVGMELAKKFNKPLVVDYRDPWLEYPYKVYPTPVHKLINQNLEREVLHAAAAIITTNRRVKELILQRHRFLDYNDVTILPQGYDPADFSADDPLPPKKPETMRVTHAGVFYGERTPRYFLQALSSIFSKQPELKGKIEAYFIGSVQDEHQALIKQMGLEEHATLTGYLEHLQCVQHLRASDVLWLMVNNDRQSPGKLYEYLGARKPILACVPDGFLRQTLQEAGASVVVSPTDVDGIAKGILSYYNLFMQKKLPCPDPEVVAKYDRVELTNELSKIFAFLPAEP